jgi:putative RNA 2'-phosphotransferase
MPVDGQNVGPSKYLCWLLRHGAATQGLKLDAAGWLCIDGLLDFARISRAELEAIVNTDPKHRLQLSGERIRACQGHSLEAGVTREALEASWTPYILDASIWHGTAVSSVSRIAIDGIMPITRTHVHCAPSRDSIVGKRAHVHVLLEISPAKIRAAGLSIFVAPNGVVLARSIPREAIIGLLPLTHSARRAEAEMRAELEL